MCHAPSGFVEIVPSPPTRVAHDRSRRHRVGRRRHGGRRGRAPAGAPAGARRRLLRRRRPCGGLLRLVLSTSIAILIGFVVFLAFESFDQSRSGAENEALAVVQQFETAQSPSPGRSPGPVGGAASATRASWSSRSGRGWRTGRAATPSIPGRSPWFRTLKRTEPVSNSEQSAYDSWLDRTAEREEARNDRLHGAEGVIPRLSRPLPAAFLIFCFMSLRRPASGPCYSPDQLGGAGPLRRRWPWSRSSTAPSSPMSPGSNPPRWSAASSCWSSSARWSATRRRRPVTTAARRGGHDPGPAGVVGRGRRDRPARAGGRGDGLVGLPGLPVARRPGARLRARDGDPRRVRPRVGPGQPSGADRRRDLHAVGSRLRPGRRRARPLLPPALPPRVPPRLRALGRLTAPLNPEAAPTPFALPEYQLQALRRPTGSRPRRSRPAR